MQSPTDSGVLTTVLTLDSPQGRNVLCKLSTKTQSIMVHDCIFIKSDLFVRTAVRLALVLNNARLAVKTCLNSDRGTGYNIPGSM